MLTGPESPERLNPDQLEALADEIATFAARIDVAEHALLTRLRVFDEHEAWGPGGFHSCAHWLSWRIGISLTAARERVRVARALGNLHDIDERFGRGELSYSKVRALTRVATPETEAELAEIALHATASQLDQLVRAYRRYGGPASTPNELPLDQRRFVRRSETRGGMVRIEVQLPPEEAAIVWEAMRSAGAASNAPAEDSSAPGAASKLDSSAPTPRSVADAPADAPAGDSAAAGPLSKLDCSESVADSPADAPAEDQAPAFVPVPAANDPVIDDPEQRRADAIVDVARAYLEHRPRTLGSGYELVVITTKEQLERGSGGVGGFLRDGTPVPLQVARMLACDGARVDVVLGEQGELLDVGRRTRAIPSAIARALWLRDGGCRVPGCGRSRHVHAHHIEGWAEGGPTSLSNLVLVCSSHHRMIHDGLLSAEIREGKIGFVDRRGRHIPAAPGSAANGHDLEELELFLREADRYVDHSTNAPRWDGTRMDLSDTLSWLFIGLPKAA